MGCGGKFAGGEAVLTQVDNDVYYPHGIGVLCGIRGRVRKRDTIEVNDYES